MFILSDSKHDVHGTAVVEDDGFKRLILPIAEVGPRLDWSLRQVYIEDELVFDRPVIKLFAYAGDLRVPAQYKHAVARSVSSFARMSIHVGVSADLPIDATYAWHADQHVLHLWRI